VPRWLDKLRRDDSPLDLPRAIAPGITVHGDRVWAWVTIPTRSTDEENTDVIHRLTVEGSSELRRLIPDEFQFKIQWSRYGGEEYRAEEIERLGGEHRVTPGQRAYIELGAARIEENAYPRRQVLLGIPIEVSKGSQLPAALRKTTRGAAGEAGEIEDAHVLLNRALGTARAWHARMAQTSFGAYPSRVKELAWALRRDLRRTVGWLPDGPLAPAGSVARLAGGAHATPHPRHMVVRTDAGDSLVRCVVPTVDGFPSTDLELPGGEWLRELTLADDLDTDGAPPVPVEVSIRGRNLPAAEAAKKLTEALSLTKEQGREAAQGTAEEPPEEILEARAVLSERLKEVRQGNIGMVADSVTWIVEAPDELRLDRLTQSLIDRYARHGINLWAPENTQHVLWKETVLGDHRRYLDTEQTRPWTTLVGGWFHGGSEVGDGTGPLLGGVIGSTPAPFRTRLTDAQLKNEPVTTVFAGRSRAGKSTALMLALAGEIILSRAHGILTDHKGDLYGIVPMLRAFGVDVTEVSTAEAASGSMDFFRYVTDPAEAASRVTDYLALMLGLGDHEGDRRIRSYLRRAAQGVAARPDPALRSTHQVILALAEATVTVDTEDGPKTVPDSAAREIGADLVDLAADPLARPIAGAPDPELRPLPTRSGLVYMRLNETRMPSREKPRSSWSDGERLSVGLLQASYAYAVYMASRVKGIPKIVGLTELHLITGYDFGRELIGWLARMGAALDTNLLLDTQAVAELAAIEGLLDQVSATYCFKVATDSEADAQASLLDLTPEPIIRARQKGWYPGQCEARDRQGRIAPVAWDYLCAEIRAWLNTTPDRAEEPAEYEEAAA
jgi:hypothetical protein